MPRKLIVLFLILIITCAIMFFLWRQALLPSILFVLLIFIKHLLYPIKYDLLWFLALCVGGMIIEVVMVNVAQGWDYMVPQVLGIPAWIPIF